MPARLSPPIEIHKHLEEIDKKAGITNEADFTWADFRQATQGDNEIRAELYAEIARQYDDSQPGVVIIKSRLSYAEIRRMEVFLTCSACNLLGKNDKPLWQFENKRFKSRENFMQGWAQLEPHMADELHKYAIEANPQWTQDTVALGEDGEQETTGGE